MGKNQLVRFDWAMKYMLKDPANYYIAEGFLSALLEEDITVEEIIDSENNIEYANDKLTRVDVLIKDKQGRRIIIEVQQGYQSDYLYRILYGTCKRVSQSIEYGGKYSNISKVISVTIAYFDLGLGDDEYLYHAKMHFCGKTTGKEIHQYTDFAQNLKPVKGANFNKIAIYPELYLIQINKYPNVVQKAIDEWIYWFKHDKVKEGSSSKNIDKVDEKLKKLNMSKEELEQYEIYLETIATNESIIESAKEEGLKKGIEKGKKEKALEIARSLKFAGLSNEMIIQSTGLSIDEIQNI